MCTKQRQCFFFTLNWELRRKDKDVFGRGHDSHTCNSIYNNTRTALKYQEVCTLNRDSEGDNQRHDYKCSVSIPEYPTGTTILLQVARFKYLSI